MSELISEKGAFLTDDLTGHVFDARLATAIGIVLNQHEVSHVHDLGCGPGWYAKFIEARKIQYTGYDANPNVVTMSLSNNATCLYADLSEKFTLPEEGAGGNRAIMSLEVGEHIPAQFEQMYLDNVFCQKNVKLIILSWAIIGQGGHGHVNCRDNAYVIEQAAQRGYAFDTDITARLRREASLPWFKNSLMVFRPQGDL